MADELDIEQPDALIGYLRDAGRIGPGEQPEVRVLHGGVSNRTVLVKRPSGEAWVLKQALAKLRVKVDWFSDVRRIHREALGLRVLESLAPAGAITPLLFEDERHHLLAMQAVPEPHENWKTMLLGGRVDFDHVTQFARLLAAIHCTSWRHRDELAATFDDRSFFESLRIEPYYEYTADQVPEAAEFIYRLVTDTRARRLAVVHGDYSPKNVLIHAGRLVLLDHEVIHWGDPAFDLGFALTHLLSKAHHLHSVRQRMFLSAGGFFLKYWMELSDVPWAEDLEPAAVRHTLGCLLARVAGRSQLEYLSEEERARQRQIVVRLMGDPPTKMTALIARFSEGL